MTYADTCVAKTTGRTSGSSSDGRVRAFGAVLAQGREAAGLSLGQVAMKAAHLHAPISRSEVYQLEQGNRPRPDALLVYVLARLYKQDFQWLIDVLRWNREHTSATVPPQSLPPQEGVMVVSGLEEDFVRRFRKLSAAQQRDVMQHLAFTEAQGNATGAALAEGRFRPATRHRR